MIFLGLNFCADGKLDLLSLIGSNRLAKMRRRIYLQDTDRTAIDPHVGEAV